MLSSVQDRCWVVSSWPDGLLQERGVVWDRSAARQPSPALPLSQAGCTCVCTVELSAAALTVGFLPVVKSFRHASRDQSTMRTTLQSKHIHLELLFSQITPLANVSKVYMQCIWYKPNTFSLLDPRVNICPRYYKDGHQILTKGKNALAEDCSWTNMWTRGPSAF